MTHLKIGDKAPKFVAKIQNGKKINLESFQNKKLILYFYPKDNTPGCTVEAKNLRDNFKILQEKGFKIIGVSPDSEEKHQKFIKKHELPFDLIADIDKKVMQDYGVWGEKKMFGKVRMGVFRTTFVIDEKGIIEQIFKKVKTKEHAEQILESYE